MVDALRVSTLRRVLHARMVGGQASLQIDFQQCDRVGLPERSAEVEVGLAERLREGRADGVVDAEAQQQVGAIEIVGLGGDHRRAGGVCLAHEGEHGVGDRADAAKFVDQGWIQAHEIGLQQFQRVHGGPVTTEIVEADTYTEFAQLGNALAAAFAGIDEWRTGQVEGQAGAGKMM